MNLQELKKRNPAELITEAEKLGIENPSKLQVKVYLNCYRTVLAF
jgi:hypothetical protein